MGIEKLTIAARAAGYAMGTSEDLLHTPRRAPENLDNPWQGTELKYTRGLQSRGSLVTIRRSVNALINWRATA